MGAGFLNPLLQWDINTHFKAQKNCLAMHFSQLVESPCAHSSALGHCWGPAAAALLPELGAAVALLDSNTALEILVGILRRISH